MTDTMENKVGSTPTYREALAALKGLQDLSKKKKDGDRKALHKQREELLQVVAEYRRTLKVKREGRKKHTRG